MARKEPLSLTFLLMSLLLGLLRDASGIYHVLGASRTTWKRCLGTSLPSPGIQLETVGASPYGEDALSPSARTCFSPKALGQCQGLLKSGQSWLFWSRELCVTFREQRVWRQGSSSASPPKKSGAAGTNGGSAPKRVGASLVGGWGPERPSSMSRPRGRAKQHKRPGDRVCIYSNRVPDTFNRAVITGRSGRALPMATPRLIFKSPSGSCVENVWGCRGGGNLAAQ